MHQAVVVEQGTSLNGHYIRKTTAGGYQNMIEQKVDSKMHLKLTNIYQCFCFLNILKL